MSAIHRGALRLAAGLVFVAGAVPAGAQTQTSGALEGSHVFCTTGCNVYGGQVNTDGTGAAWVVLMDSATAPGTVLATGCTVAASPRPCIMKWYQMSVSTVLNIIDFFGFNGSNRLGTKAGFTAVCSSTGPFTITPTPHCVFSFETLPN